MPKNVFSWYNFPLIFSFYFVIATLFFFFVNYSFNKARHYIKILIYSIFFFHFRIIHFYLCEFCCLPCIYCINANYMVIFIFFFSLLSNNFFIIICKMQRNVRVEFSNWITLTIYVSTQKIFPYVVVQRRRLSSKLVTVNWQPH